jgi:cytochrome c oxidase subunit IV
MATHTPRNSREEHEQMEHASGARYWIVWAALIAGTIITFATSRLHLPHPYGLIVAMIIASVKAMLVVLFFMHLWDHGGANRLVFGTSVFFVLLLIGLTVLDNASRFDLTNPGHDEATLKMEPPGPDILSPKVGTPAEGRGRPEEPKH